MTSIQVRLPSTWPLGVQEHLFKGRCCNISYLGYSGPNSPSKLLIFLRVQYLVRGSNRRSARKNCSRIFSSAVDDGMDPDDSGDESDKDESPESKAGDANSKSIRDNLERIVGTDDSAFSGLDLATLIRNKYGRSYDVQLIKKEFMGRNLLAMNVMWKYVEQKSFPLTEEEYLLRLDDVANTLKCWGAVSHIRNSLIISKERPRIGKAVSIFIDMDESGGRANEWIYR